MAITGLFEGFLPNLPVVNSTYNFQGNFLRSMKEKKSFEKGAKIEENYLQDLLEFLKEDPDTSNLKVEFINQENNQVIQEIEQVLALVQQKVAFKEVRIIITIMPDLELNYCFNSPNRGIFYVSSMPQLIFRFKSQNDQLSLTLRIKDHIFKIKSKFNADTNGVDVYGSVVWEKWQLNFKYNRRSFNIRLQSQDETWKIKFANVNDLLSAIGKTTETPDDVVSTYIIRQFITIVQIRDFLLTQQVTIGRITFAYSRFDLREDNLPEVDAVVILPNICVDKVQDVEEAYLDYVAALKENGAHDLCVTFWNE